MKLAMLAGDVGSRLSEETLLKPKPMVEIGGKPILWHIIKLYSYFGINDFILCLSYKEHFPNHLLYMSNVNLELLKNELTLNKAFVTVAFLLVYY